MKEAQAGSGAPEDELESLRARIAELEERLATETAEHRRTEAAYKLNEERLDALLKLSEKRDCSEEELSQYAIDEAVRLTGSEIGYLHFVNAAEDGFLSYVWSRGSREVCRAVEAMNYSLDSAGIWADSLRLKRPVIHNDYPNEKTRRGLPEGHLPLSRHLGVPVLKAGKVVAVGGVANKATPYDSSDLRQLRLFAGRLWSIVEAKRAESELERANIELSGLASIDGLTGVANRRVFDETLAARCKVAQRDGSEISILMADIDSFKAYNDFYGHPAGDEVLKRVAGALAAVARRPGDLAARYGGEEFVVILAGTKGADALALASMAVERVATLGIPHAASSTAPFVTMSVGVAELRGESATFRSVADLLAAADAALYAAKREGKNRALFPKG